MLPKQKMFSVEIQSFTCCMGAQIPLSDFLLAFFPKPLIESDLRTLSK